ncbi:MAG: fasciclin domain-containing protein [Patescibacteria group bacterium]|nr:fasciclin domain-containing protein [Patescibacteria group bacterium]
MKGQSSTTAWVIGLIILVLIAIGIWWWAGSSSTSVPPIETATTTAATSTNPSSPSVGVTNETASTVDAIVASVADASDFNAYFRSTGVSSITTGAGPYTIFVPINEAFNALPAGTVSNLSAAGLKRLVEYHVVSGRALNIDAVSSGDITTLSKDMLNFNVNLSTQTAQVGSYYAVQEYKASNGVVYLITGVLLPPAQAQQ